MKTTALTLEQKLVIDQILANIETRKNSIGSLLGPAGCGKTTTLQHLAKEIARLLGSQSVIFVTPTHKAAGVLREQMPKGVKVITIAKMIGVSTKQNKDKVEFTKPSVEMLHKKADELKRNGPLRVVVVDESSMVSQEDADIMQQIVSLCDNVMLFFSGDPYQLPPIENNKDQPDESEEVVYSKNMCKQFVLTDGLSCKLTKVLRHGGPVLDYATFIRSNWTSRHYFPKTSQRDSESFIQVIDSEAVWMQNFFQHVKQHGLKARALTHKNDNCKALTDALRFSLYGMESRKGWMPGEKITFPKYTVAPNNEKIYSCSDATVIDSKIIDIKKTFLSFDYVTPAKQLERTIDIGIDGQFQEITIELERWRSRITVFAPLLNDGEQQASRMALRKRLNQMQEAGIINGTHEVWHAMRQVNSYFPVIYSANVMTVHKSQGSTFDYVFIHKDVQECRADYSNALLYVATTRARKGLYFCNG